MSKHKNLISKSLFINENGGKIVLCLLIAVILTVPIALAFATASIQPSAQTEKITTPIEQASSNSQFQIHLAYAYVGPAPSNVSAYFDQAKNTTMRLVSQYPSVVRLNITCIPCIQFGGCDAVVEVYGIKIATDKGPTEYHAYFVGTNYNPVFSDAYRSKLIQSVANIVNMSLYSNVAGNFKLSWTDNTSLLTNSIGSITSYIDSSTSALGLFNEGKPNVVSVAVYRIGYVTMTEGLVSVFVDSASNAKDMVQLSSYGSGFLHNDVVPTDQMPQTDIFHPVTPPIGLDPKYQNIPLFYTALLFIS